MTVWECMRYAVEHSHGLRQRALQLDNAKATRSQAIGSFLPSVGASISGQLNFGRAIDPETNTYTNVSTLGSGYGLQASLPLFDGLYRLHALLAARADVLMQKNALQAARDQVALQTYQAFIEVVYAREATRLASEKLSDSELLLRQTRTLEEEGLKSPADVAQIQAQLAADALTLTQQENQAATAMLKLKEVMGWELNDALSVKADAYSQTEHFTLHTSLSEQQQAIYTVKAARHSVGTARAAFYPTLSLSGGVNSSYYRNLDAAGATSFGRQLKNNLGEWVGLSLSIPLFNRLSNLTALRRAKNNLRIAEEQCAEKMTELEVMRRQAHLDLDTNAKEITQSQAKVEADSLAYELVRRQFTEGLASPVEVQTAATTLLQSRAALLQHRLLRGVRQLQVGYYDGESLVPEGLHRLCEESSSAHRSPSIIR